MKLYLIRHGESDNNVSGCYSGWEQVLLTEKGIEDAKSIRPLLENVKFDKIYSSDLIRAMNTCETALPGCVYETSPLLREVNVGTLGNKPFLPKDAPERRQMNDGFKEYGGENYDEFRVRIREFLSSLEGSEHKCVAAFTHAGFLRNTLSILLDANVTHATVECSNCAVAILNYVNGGWQLSCWINPQ